MPEHKTVFSVMGFERAKLWRVMGTADMMFSRHASMNVIYMPYTPSKNVARYPPKFDSNLLPENPEKGLSRGRINETLVMFTGDSEQPPWGNSNHLTYDDLRDLISFLEHFLLIDYATISIKHKQGLRRGGS